MFAVLVGKGAADAGKVNRAVFPDEEHELDDTLCFAGVCHTYAHLWVVTVCMARSAARVPHDTRFACQHDGTRRKAPGSLRCAHVKRCYNCQN